MERQEKQVNDEHLYEELKRLRKENARLKEERDILKKGRSVLRTTAAVKYAWIQEQHAEFSVTSLCRILEVSRSGYYEWLGRLPASNLTPISSWRRK